MKTLFIPAKSKSTVNKNKILDISKKLPKNLAIAYSIQFQEIANEIKDLVIEAESLQAEEKAVFHQLFGVDTET